MNIKKETIGLGMSDRGVVVIRFIAFFDAWLC